MSIFLLALVILEGFVLNVSMHFELIAVFFLVGFAYQGIYLFLFYKWGTNIAQYAIATLFAIFGGAYLVIEKLNISLEPISITTGIGVIFIVAGVAFYIASALMSWKFYEAD